MRLDGKPVRLTGFVLALALIAGCAEKPDAVPQDGPGAAAMNLFTLAIEENRPAELDSAFDPGSLDGGDVALADSLDVLAGLRPPELIGVYSSDDGVEAFCDLAVELPGGGRATYNVKLSASPDGGWRIAWFQGPGVEWPRRERRGDGLTTSLPPEDGPGG